MGANEVINNICNKLGCAASEITPEMAHYMIIRHFIVLGVCILVIIAGILVLVYIETTYRKDKKEYKAQYENWKTERKTGGFCNFREPIKPERGDFFPFYLIPSMVIASVLLLSVMETVIVAGWIVSPQAAMVDYVLSRITTW